MSKLIQLAALTGALTLAGPVFACTNDTPDEWECLTENTANPAAGPNLIDQGAQGPYTFEGVTVLAVTIPPLTATCTLGLTGEVEVQSSSASGVPGGITYITIQSGDITGGGICDDLGLSGFDWEATKNGSLGVPGANGGDVYPAYSGFAVADIDNIVVTYNNNPICEGTLSGVEFHNGSQAGNPSYFKFDGSLPSTIPLSTCSVNGTLLSVDGDVDAW